VSVNGQTDTRKPIWFSGFAAASRDESGTHAEALGVTADMRPTSFLHVTLGPQLALNNATGQFVRSVSDALATSTFGRRYVFANIDQTTLYMIRASSGRSLRCSVFRCMRSRS
jgi:hypothetical protein